MRALRLLPLLALTGLVLLSAPAPAAAAAQAGEDAKIVDFDYSPGRLTVDAGTTVTWTNTGASPTPPPTGAAPSTPGRSPPGPRPRSP